MDRRKIEDLLDRLREMMPGTSRRTFKQLMERGRVLVNGQAVRRGDHPLEKGARVTILPKAATTVPARKPEAEAARELPVLHEDRHLIVVDKPAGMLSVSTRRLAGVSLWSSLRHALRARGRGEKVFLVHRLDKDASGLLVFAKTEKVRDELKRLFSRHEIDRHYAVVVRGRMEDGSGAFRGRLVELEDSRHSVRGLRPGDTAEMKNRSREAITRWRVHGRRDRFTAVEVRLETGRKHQIRVQFAEARHPVVGDRLYRGPDAERLMLHAWLLGFKHPVTGRPIRTVAPLPEAMEKATPGAFGAPGVRLIAEEKRPRPTSRGRPGRSKTSPRPSRASRG